jgi:hypothetical protein
LIQIPRIAPIEGRYHQSCNSPAHEVLVYTRAPYLLRASSVNINGDVNDFLSWSFSNPINANREELDNDDDDDDADNRNVVCCPARPLDFAKYEKIRCVLQRLPPPRYDRVPDRKLGAR